MYRVASLLAVTALMSVACMNSGSSSLDSAAAPDERAAVESASARFHQALRTNDSATFYSYVADDVLMMPPGQPPVHGIDAMRTWYSAFLNQYQTSSLSLGDREVFAGDDWAAETGSFAWGLRPTAGGAEVVDRGHYIQVWKKASGGQWKFYREVWNSGA